MPGCANAVALMCVAAASLSAQATLFSPEDTLGEILKQSALPNCTDVEQLRATKKSDAQWLFTRLKNTGWSNVAPPYAASLTDLLEGLRKAAKDPDTIKACEEVRLIVRDLHTKREDCKKLGHSRIEIPVRIRTVRGNAEVKDWEVYTRWLPAGDRFTTIPKRLRGLSSPAQGTVPIPGEFEIYAQDPASGAKTEPARVSIGGTQTFEWTIPIARTVAPASR